MMFALHWLQAVDSWGWSGGRVGFVEAKFYTACEKQALNNRRLYN